MEGSLGHVGYNVADLEETLGTYRALLGARIELQTTMPGSGAKLAFLRVGGLLMELMEPVDKKGLEGAPGPVFDHPAFEVDDLDGVVARLQAAGASFESPKPRQSLLGGRTIICRSAALGGRVQLMGK